MDGTNDGSFISNSNKCPTCPAGSKVIRSSSGKHVDCQQCAVGTYNRGDDSMYNCVTCPLDTSVQPAGAPSTNCASCPGIFVTNIVGEDGVSTIEVKTCSGHGKCVWRGDGSLPRYTHSLHSHCPFSSLLFSSLIAALLSYSLITTSSLPSKPSCECEEGWSLGDDGSCSVYGSIPGECNHYNYPFSSPLFSYNCFSFISTSLL